MRQNKNTWFYIGGSGLDRTDDFQKFCGSGLDRIQFYRIRTGLGLKNFTVAHLCHVFHIMIRLDSCHNQWLETRARVIFAKFQSLWSTNPVCLHTKKWSFFGPGMIKIGATFLFWLSSPVILYPKGQVFITCTEVDLRFAFHWGGRRAHPIRYLHIMAVGHILLLWVFSRWSDLSYLNTNPMQKYTAQYNSYRNSCHCY